MKRWILLNLPGQTLGQQSRLQLKTASIAGLVPEEGMLNLFVESLLKLGKEQLAPFIIQSIRTQFYHEVIWHEHPFVEHCQDHRVHDDRPEFFHQVKG